VQIAAVPTMVKLQPEARDKHTAIIAKAFESSKAEGTHYLAKLSKALSILDPASLAVPAVMIIPWLEDDDNEVRIWAVKELGRLEPADLQQHALALLKFGAEEQDLSVQLAAVPTMVKLQPEARDKHTAILRSFESANNFTTTLQQLAYVLERLEPTALAPLAAEIVTMLGNPHGCYVRKPAVLALFRLEPAFLESQVANVTSLSSADADLVVAQLRGRWRRIWTRTSRRTSGENGVHAVDAKLEWDFAAPFGVFHSGVFHPRGTTTHSIRRNANFIITSDGEYNWWVSNISVVAGQLKSIVWSNSTEATDSQKLPPIEWRRE